MSVFGYSGLGTSSVVLGSLNGRGLGNMISVIFHPSSMVYCTIHCRDRVIENNFL